MTPLWKACEYTMLAGVGAELGINDGTTVTGLEEGADVVGIAVGLDVIGAVGAVGVPLGDMVVGDLEGAFVVTVTRFNTQIHK